VLEDRHHHAAKFRGQVRRVLLPSPRGFDVRFCDLGQRRGLLDVLSQRAGLLLQYRNERRAAAAKDGHRVIDQLGVILGLPHGGGYALEQLLGLGRPHFIDRDAELSEGLRDLLITILNLRLSAVHFHQTGRNRVPIAVRFFYD
jgi:hypothetical protein